MDEHAESGVGEGEGVTMEDKIRCRVRGKIEYFAGMAADIPTIDSLGKWYEAFGGWGMAVRE